MKTIILPVMVLVLSALVGCSNEDFSAKGESPAGSSNLQEGASVLSLSLTPENPTLQVGQVQQFVAKALLSDGTQQDVTITADWSTSNVGVATVDATASIGTIRAMSSGISYVKASYQGKDVSVPMLVINRTANLTKTFCLYYEDLPVKGDMDYNDVVVDLRGDVFIDDSFIVANSAQTLSLKMYQNAGCSSRISIRSKSATGEMKTELTFNSHGTLPELKLPVAAHDQIVVYFTPLDYCATGDTYSLPSSAVKVETAVDACDPDGP
jgi:uncharacterized protein YcfL